MRAWGWVLVVLMPGAAGAGDCRQVARVRNVVVQQSFAVTPFAVPVAVPVATFVSPTVMYSFQGYAADAMAARGLAALDPRHPARALSEAAAEQKPAAEAGGLVRQKCGRCHGGEAPKGGLDLTDLAGLEAAKRLEAVRRVVSDDPAVRMPKGGTLSPAEIGAVLQELSGR